LLARDIHPEPLQRVGHEFLGERRVAQPVAGSVEADNEPVAKQIIAAHPVEFHQILDADRPGQGRPGAADHNEAQGEGNHDHAGEMAHDRKFARLRRAVRAVIV